MPKPAERYPVPKTIRAHLEYEGDPREIPIRLIDFSTTGAGLEMSEVPRSGAPVIIVMANGSQRFELSAVLKWAAPREGLWRAGCQFSQGIGAPRMFGTEPNRAACDMDVRVSSQESQVRDAAATIVDHSPGGIGILADFTPKPGTQLMVTGADGESRFIVTVQWWSRDKSECFVGTQFARPSDRLTFRRLLNLTPVRCS